MQKGGALKTALPFWAKRERQCMKRFKTDIRYLERMNA